ncbi:plasmid recombination protein, partial [Streptococcus suis]|nr:plasmid recombination protein [Streptococcus suis]
MSMIVARMQKMKAENLVGIGNHNQRKTKNHSNPDIDTSLSKLNYDLVDRTQNYKTDIENFINENKSTTRAVRKDAVLVNEWIISSDKDFFDNLTESEIENFFERSKDYFAEKFGEKNIRYATVHLDESTPHMHMGIVPFDKDNKLSAKRVFNRQALRDVQEELPKYLQDFQFEIARGQKGSERKNLTVPEFKKLKEEELEIKKELQIKKDELIAYTKENQIDKKLDITPIKEMEDIEIETDEKTLFGKNKTEIVRQWTGNIILSENDYLKLNKEIKKGKKTEGRLAAILETDVYQENKELKNELKDQIDKNDKDIDDYND